MKRNVKNFGLLVTIFVVIVMLLGGCCYVCPTCPSQSQEFKPQILVNEMGHCQVLAYMREIAPCAGYRWPAKEWYQLSNLTDTQIVLNNINLVGDVISDFHSQPGCSQLPFGYIKYKDENKYYVTMVVGDSGINFYKLIGPNGYLERMYPDYYIAEIVLY